MRTGSKPLLHDIRKEPPRTVLHFVTAGDIDYKRAGRSGRDQSDHHGAIFFTGSCVTLEFHQ